MQSGIPPSSLAAERYRSLAVRLEEPIQKAGDSGYLLTVTSPEPAAGKTFTSLNLALCFARIRERRVLLVECDLRRPGLSNYLETDTDNPGVAHLLEQSVDLSEAVVPVWGTGLELVTAGTSGTVENLMADRKMVELLEEMRTQYEIVILDSAPLLLASGQSIASRADGVLLVARAGKTKKSDLEEALSTLEPNKVLGLVLNDVRPAKLGSPVYSTYGYYGSERPSSLGGEDSFLGDLQLREAGVTGRALARGRRSRLFDWRIGLVALSIAVVVGLAVAVWLRPPAGDTAPGAPPAVVAPTEESAPLSADGAAQMPSTFPATGRTTALTPLRHGPGTDHTVVVPLEAGLEVRVEESDGDWLRVKTGDLEGWVLAALVAFDAATGVENG